MKKTSLSIALGILCLSLTMIFPASEVAYAKDKVIKLKCANYFPPPAEQSKIVENFIKDLEMRTNGRIEVKYFTGGSLLKGSGMYKGIEAGIVDIGFSHVFYTAGRMPVTEFAGLPLGYPSGWVATHVLNDFYAKVRPKEWDKVKPLWFYGSPPTIVISTKPVRKLEDLRGLTIRAPGTLGDVIHALGGSPAPTPVVEVYDSMSKGVIDGAFLVYECLKGFRLAEVAKYTTICWQVGGTYPFYAAMNKNSYRKLPADLKGIFDDLCGEYAERSALMVNAIDIFGKKFGTQKGIEYIELSDQEAARWKTAVEPIISSWIQKMVEMGYSKAEVKGWISFLRERIDYYSKLQIKYQIPSVTGSAAMRPENIVK